MAALAMIDEGNTIAAQLLGGYSFEISAREAQRLDGIRASLADGTIVSITNLPGESDAARIEAAARIRAAGLVPMPHVAARRIESSDSLSRTLDGFGRVGVDRLFLVAGDVPAPSGPYPDALSVIDAVDFTQFGIRTIAITGYPDGHPGIGRAALDSARRDKLAALSRQGVATEIMTQFGFEADPIIAWLRDIRADGVGSVVRLGLPGPASAGTLLKYAARCGVGVSARAMSRFGLSLTRLLSSAGPDRLHADLARAIAAEPLGSVAVHIFPFGGLTRMVEWTGAVR